MKKLITLSTMALAMVFSASMAFSGTLTLPIAWYLNDANGTFGAGADTFLTLKNNTPETVTMTMQFYDNDDLLNIATTDTIEIVPFGVRAYYTGLVAASTPQLGAPNDYAFGLGAAGDRGSIIIIYDDFGGTYTKARQVITGYETIETGVGTGSGSSFGINFDYLDD